MSAYNCRMSTQATGLGSSFIPLFAKYRNAACKDKRRVFVPWSLPAGLFAAMNNLECVHPSDTYNRTTSAATSAGVCVSSSLSPCAVPVGCSWAFLVSLYRWKRSINRTATHCQVVLFQMQGFLLIVFTRKWTSCSHALPILFLITGWVQET